MRASEIRDLTSEEIVARIKEEEENLLRLRLNHAVSAVERPSDIRKQRRLLARLKTILQERKQVEPSEVAETES
ncbi:MAG: 50S ribosomal protein L29 [Bacteroidota bacterium]